MSKSGISRPCHRLIFIFLRNSHTDLHSGCVSLYFHQQWISVLLSSYPHHHKLEFALLIWAFLTWVRWNLSRLGFSWTYQGTNNNMKAFNIVQSVGLLLVQSPALLNFTWFSSLQHTMLLAAFESVAVCVCSLNLLCLFFSAPFSLSISSSLHFLLQLLAIRSSW